MVQSLTSKRPVSLAGTAVSTRRPGCRETAVVVSAAMTRHPNPNRATGSAWAVALPAVILLIALAVPARAQEKYEPADIEYGSRVYAAQCAVCHGATGDTVNGVDLKGRIRRAGGDFELMALISTGIQGTAMPAFKFSTAEMTGIVAYV